MTLKQFTFEGTNGATVTALNSGASQVLAGAPGSAIYDTGQVGASGVTGIKLVMVSGTSCVVRLALNATSNQLAAAVVFRTPTSTPSSNFTLIDFIDTAGTTVARLIYTTANKLQLQTVGGTGVWVSTSTYAVNTQFRIEFQMSEATSTTGSVSLQLFNSPTSTTPLSDTFSSNSVNLGTTPFQYMDLGDSGGGASVTIGYDDAQLNDGTLTPIGPYTPPVNSPPTLTMGPDVTVPAGGTANVTSSASDSDGTIASYAWSFDSIPPGASTPTLTGGTTANASFTAAANGVYVLRQTVTDNGGATASHTLNVFATSATPVITGVTSNSGAWTNQGGAATFAIAVNDGSDSTLIQSPPVTATEEDITLRIAPMPVMTALSVVLGDKISSAGTVVHKVRILEGATVRKEWTGPTLTTSLTTESPLTMNSGECAAVGSWNQLDIQLTASNV